MVEGHSVHRISHRHTQLLVGHKFKATSPNNRFTEGAKAINQKTLRRAEAKGKQLFYWFSNTAKNNDLQTLREAKDVYVVNVHFGMSGQFHTFGLDKKAPDPSATTRLRLVRNDAQVTAHLSAMTCLGGGVELYDRRAGALGEDPLRDDADPEALFKKIQKCTATQTIGRLLMDQRFFPGVGNIYRCECLFVAGVWPNAIARDLSRAHFAKVWSACVKLLRRGFETGSILTVDANEGLHARRYIYNRSTCARCGSHVLSWDVGARTCYGCVTCQPIGKVTAVTATDSTQAALKFDNPVAIATPTRPVPRSSHATKQNKQTATNTTTTVARSTTTDIEMRVHVPFPSSCAQSDPVALTVEKAYTAMRVTDLRRLCLQRRLTVNGRKSALVHRLRHHDDNQIEVASAVSVAESTDTGDKPIKRTYTRTRRMRPRQSLERITNKDGSVIIEDTAEVSITAVAAGKGALKGTEQTPATSRRKRKAVEEVTPTAIALGAASLQPLRVADLRVLCAARGLSVAGRKRQLIHRLLAHAQSASGPVISVYDSGASCNALDMDGPILLARLLPVEVAFESPGRFQLDSTHVASYKEAAKEKERAKEPRNVEHVADIDWTDLKGE